MFLLIRLHFKLLDETKAFVKNKSMPLDVFNIKQGIKKEEKQEKEEEVSI